MIRTERESRFERSVAFQITVDGPGWSDQREPSNLPSNQEARAIYEAEKASLTGYGRSYVEVPRDEAIWLLRVINRGNHVAVVALSDAEGHRAVTESQAMPVLLADREGRFWWLFNGVVYSTKEELEPDEVLALIGEQENKKKLKIARAKTVAAMADQLDRSGKRQAIPQDVKVAVWQRDGGSCVKCGATSELEFDHIIPLAAGGANTFRNLQLLCGSCNREKGASL